LELGSQSFVGLAGVKARTALEMAGPGLIGWLLGGFFGHPLTLAAELAFGQAGVAGGDVSCELWGKGHLGGRARGNDVGIGGGSVGKHLLEFMELVVLIRDSPSV